jgi:hypothetical protein
MCKIWVKWTMSIVDRVIYFTGDGENNFSWKCNFFWWQKVKRISFLLVSISEIYYTKDRRGIISSQNLLIQFLVLSFDTFLYMKFVLVPWWNMESALVRIWWFVDCQIHACFQQDLLQNRFVYPRPPKGEGGILFYLCPSFRLLPSVLPSVQDNFHRIFLSNYWWQKSDIWSQASYRYPILWEAILDPSDSYFLFADFVDFYTHWTYILYMPIFSRIFLSNCWWQKSDIWSQASYRYPISWESFFDPSDSYFLFAEERGYHKWALALIHLVFFKCWSKKWGL